MTEIFIRLNERGKAANGVSFFEVLSNKIYKVYKMNKDGNAVIWNEMGVVQFIQPQYFDFIPNILHGATIKLNDSGYAILAERGMYPLNENQTYLVLDDSNGTVRISPFDIDFHLTPEMYKVVSYIPG